MAERHLDDQEVIDWVAGRLAPAARARAEQHIDRCRSCRDLVAGVLRSSLCGPSAGLVAPPALAERYEILDPIGRGGMGVVYRAAPIAGGPPVALKLLRPGGGPEAVARFEREARLAAALDHPGIVRILDHGATPDGTLFIAMEMLEGEDLATRLARRRRPLDADEVIRIGCEAASALGAAHAAGVVHRDVKPANLFLCAGGARVKLLDFGLAVAFGRAGELTRTRMAVGTPAYMAPEQATGGRKEDARTDVWGLGATLYTALTIRPPFAAAAAAAVLVRIANDAPDALPASVPPALRDAIVRALEKDPGKRFQSMSRFERALRGDTAVEGTGRERVPAAPRTPPPAAPSPDRTPPSRTPPDRTPPPRTPPPQTPPPQTPPQTPPPIEPDRTTAPIVTAAAAAIGVAVLLGVVLFGALALRVGSGGASNEGPPAPPGFTRHEGDGWSFVASSVLARDPAPPAGTTVLLAGIGTEHVSFGISPYPGDPTTYIQQNAAQLPNAQIEILRITDRPAGRAGFDMEILVRSGDRSMRLVGRTLVIDGDAYCLTCAALEPGFESLRGRCETTIQSLSIGDR